MGQLLYRVVMINARILEFEADEVECEEGIYKFYCEGELVAEFKRDNIAGYFVSEIDE